MEDGEWAVDPILKTFEKELKARERVPDKGGFAPAPPTKKENPPTAAALLTGEKRAVLFPTSYLKFMQNGVQHTCKKTNPQEDRQMFYLLEKEPPQ